MPPRLHTILPIIASLALLAGAGANVLQRPKPTSAEPYHRHIRQALNALPLLDDIRDKDYSFWHGKDVEVDAGATGLLKPNVMINRRYQNSVTGEIVDFLLVQSGDAQDLQGHWPPVCYPGAGWVANGSKSGAEMTWQVRGRAADGAERPSLDLDGTEYQFTRFEDTEYVDSILMLPDGRTPRSMNVIRKAAGDYRRHYFGATHIQMVFLDRAMSLENRTPERRKEVFEMFLTAARPLIDAIRAGGDQP